MGAREPEGLGGPGAAKGNAVRGRAREGAVGVSGAGEAEEEERTQDQGRWRVWVDLTHFMGSEPEKESRGRPKRGPGWWA